MEAPDPFEQAQDKITQQLETKVDQMILIASALDKTLITLSGGALVFSMTFIGTLAPFKHLLWLLFLSWALFTTCIIAVIFAMKSSQNLHIRVITALTKLAADHDKHEPMARRAGYRPKLITKLATQRPVTILNIVALTAFTGGVILLGIFVGFNLWTTT